MMYHEKMAVAIKTKGKVLREFNRDSVYIPFGEEYSILIKNLNTVKALVSVSIDGNDVADGDSFVIEGNSELEITRFIKNGNLNKGNRFKFIERTAGVESHRGVQVEDGLVRVEFSYEKVVPKYDYNHIIHQHHYYPKTFVQQPWTPPFTYCSTTLSAGDGFAFNGSVGSAVSGSLRSANLNPAAVAQGAVSTTTITSNSANFAQVMPHNDAGITVEGSVSEQQFHQASSFTTESVTHAIVFKLFGSNEAGRQVVAPVTVKTKQKCKTCGKVNKATAKFCVECGTSLEIV